MATTVKNVWDNNLEENPVIGHWVSWYENGTPYKVFVPMYTRTTQQGCKAYIRRIYSVPEHFEMRAVRQYKY